MTQILNGLGNVLNTFPFFAYGMDVIVIGIVAIIMFAFKTQAASERAIVGAILLGAGYYSGLIQTDGGKALAIILTIIAVILAIGKDSD